MNVQAAPLDVSVVLPTWNRVEYLRATIDSVLGQSVGIRELIIADDGSDPAARMVLKEYAALARVRVLWREHCGNPGTVRNAAIHAASGKYIAFADSDDVWHAEKLARQFAALAGRPECRWSFTSWSCIDARGLAVASPDIPTRRAPARPLIESLAIFAVRVPLPSVLAERTLLLEAGLFDESFGCYADYDLWVRLAAISDAAALSDPLVAVRLHDRHFSRGAASSTTSGRHRFAGHALRHVRTPRIRSQLQRMRALDSARLAGLAALAGDRREMTLRLRSSVEAGWILPRWWFIAVRAYSRLWGLRP